MKKKSFKIKAGLVWRLTILLFQAGTTIAYAGEGAITIHDVIARYWPVLLSFGIISLAMCLSMALFIKLNQNIRSKRDKLQKKNEAQALTKIKLKDSEAKLKSIFTSAPIGIGLVVNRKLGMVNQRLCDITGYSTAELSGQSIRLLYPDEKEFLRMGLIKQEQIEQKGQCSLETRWKRKNGAIINILLNSTPIDPDDGLKTEIFTALNVTALRAKEAKLAESEARYRSMMEGMNDPAYICSPDFRITYMNPAMVKRIGYDATGENCFNALHGIKNKCLWCLHDEVQKNRHCDQNILSPKDNRSFHVSHSPIAHEDGSISKMTVFRDTTRFHEMEAQLRKAQKMESIGTLAGGIAHDFNNILFPIIGYTELMLAEIPEGSSFQRNLNMVLASSKRAQELVKQILTFSRKTTHELKPLSCQLVVKEVLKLIKSTLPSTIEIHQHVDNNCGLVLVDPTHIHQIMMNLCTNSFHAMEEKGGILTVTLEETVLTSGDIKDNILHPGRYVSLTVADTGIGMPSEVKERIFYPYFTTKKDGKGTGLGLSVVHGIVKNCQGHISVQSSTGNGTSIQVCLPLITTANGDEEDSGTTIIKTGVEQILLVDDEAFIVQLETQILTKLGYSVSATTDSLDALEIFKANPDRFDIVISDMTMPNMTGDELAIELMKIRTDIPVILCTGYSESITNERAERLGIKALLIKPVSMGDLSNFIRMALDTP